MPAPNLSQVLASCPRTRFVIVGREAQIKVAQLQEQAERLGIAHRIRFTGSVPQVSSLVAAFDVATVRWFGSLSALQRSAR